MEQGKGGTSAKTSTGKIMKIQYSFKVEKMVRMNLSFY